MATIISGAIASIYLRVSKNKKNMKAIKILLIAVWGLAIQTSTAQAQLFSLKSHKVTVNGTSSIHDWESTVEKIECKGSLEVANNMLAEISDVVVTIPVKSIKSPKGKMMDHKTWEAFNYEKTPAIIFKLTGKKINPENRTLNAVGTLTMAGVTKTVDLDLAYKILNGGAVQVTGSKKLKMTDFKMDPPTAMMGTIKVGDEVEVFFDLVLIQNNNTL